MHTFIITKGLADKAAAVRARLPRTVQFGWRRGFRVEVGFRVWGDRYSVFRSATGELVCSFLTNGPRVDELRVAPGWRVRQSVAVKRASVAFPHAHRAAA